MASLLCTIFILPLVDAAEGRIQQLVGQRQDGLLVLYKGKGMVLLEHLQGQSGVIFVHGRVPPFSEIDCLYAFKNEPGELRSLYTTKKPFPGKGVVHNKTVYK